MNRILVVLSLSVLSVVAVGKQVVTLNKYHQVNRDGDPTPKPRPPKELHQFSQPAWF